MTTVEQRRIEDMLFDPAKLWVWRLEISLTTVVEARQSSNILHRIDGDSIDDHADHDCSKNN